MEIAVYWSSSTMANPDNILLSDESKKVLLQFKCTDDCISSVYLQGNDAELFYSEVKAICKRFPSIAEDVAEIIVAYDYLGE